MLSTTGILNKFAAYQWKNKFAAYQWNPKLICCVPLESYINLLRTTGSPTEICCVPQESSINLLPRPPPAAGKIYNQNPPSADPPTPNPGPPPAAGKIYNPNPLALVLVLVLLLSPHGKAGSAGKYYNTNYRRLSSYRISNIFQ